MSTSVSTDCRRLLFNGDQTPTSAGERQRTNKLRNPVRFLEAMLFWGAVAVPCAAQARPDLVPSGCSLSRSEVKPGQSLTVTANVCNQGNFGTAQFWGDRIFINATPVDSGAQVIGGPYCKNFPQFILPGQCYSTFGATAVQSVTVPASQAPGVWHIGYRTNLTDSQTGPCTPGQWAFGESDHDNNTCWLPLRVSIPTVFRWQKLSSTSGGLSGPLDDGDSFGVGSAPLGDLDGDGVNDLVVGAKQDDDGGLDRGAAWVLFLNPEGTVKSEVKISDTQGGFLGVLDDLDGFGQSVTVLGDLDGDGISDLAVGAPGDDDGGSGRGAVWVLFLNSDGTVRAEAKISDSSGGFGGLLGDGYSFGGAVETLGDLDNDDVCDLAVGANAAANGGALWILFLNADGTVKAEQEISETAGRFGGQLDPGDEFGGHLSLLGDHDGDGVVDLAVGAIFDDDGATNGGAVWVLFLDTDGTVKSEQKISATSGGFGGVLGVDDRFSGSLCSIGDLDGDGDGDLAVGSYGDDDGSANAGAVWLLHLNTNGTVKSEQKISAPIGGFGGTLDSGDFFGTSLSLAGDLDGDGRLELSVGATMDDDGGTDRGAMWILSLLEPGDTVWTGAASTSWFSASNWTDGLPGPSRSAIIPAAGTLPTIGVSGMDASCLDLALGVNGTLSLVTAAEELKVHRDARVAGVLTGSGGLRFVGSGGISATTPIGVPVTVQALGTVEFEATLDLSGSLTLVGGTIRVDGGSTTTVGGAATFSGGTLTGDGLLRFNGDVAISTIAAEPPDMEVAGDLTLDSTQFAPTGGTIVFDGTSLQTVTQTGGAIPFEFAGLELAVGSDVLFSGDLLVHGDADWSGNGESTGSIEFEGNVTCETLNPVFMIAGGDIEHGGAVFGPGKMILDPDGIVRMNTAGGLVVDLDQPILGDVEVIGGGVLTIAGGLFGVQGDLSVLDARVVSEGDLDLSVQGTILISAQSEFDVQGNHIDVLGDPAINVFGDLLVATGGELAMTACPVVVGSGGRLHIVGEDGAPAAFQEADSTMGGYTVEIQLGGTLEARDFLVQRPGLAGLRIVDAATSLGIAPLDLREGRFNLPASVANARLLDIESTADVALLELEFSGGIPGTNYNVRVPSSSSLVQFINWSGSFAGPAFEFPTDDFADWGTTLTYLTVREQPGLNTVYWKTVRQGEVEKYVLDRATGAGPFAPLAEVDPTAPPQLYAVPDATITPATPYRYRLSERFPGGALRELGVVRTDGVPNPPSRRGSFPPPVAPLQSAGGGVMGPTGSFASIQDALDAGGSGEPVLMLSLEAGTYPGFEVRGQSVRLQPAGEGEVVIDVSRGPIRIERLGARQSVELAGLELLTTSMALSALVVEDCGGLVLLDGIEAADVRLENASAVVLQGCRIGRLQASRSPRVFAASGELGSVTLADSSRLESWGWNGLLERDSTSTWVDHGRERPELTLELDEGDVLAMGLRAAPSQRWWLLASLRLGMTRPLDGLPLLLEAPVRLRQGGFLDSSGSTRRRVIVPPGLIGQQLLVQALLLDTKSGRLSFSNVQRSSGVR